MKSLGRWTRIRRDQQERQITAILIDPHTSGTDGDARTLSRLAVLLIAAALSGLAFVVQQYSLRRYGLSLDVPEWLWVQLATGWVFLLAGLTARRRQPRNAIGMYMIVFGLIWVGRLSLTAPLFQWHELGESVALYGILLVILLAFPTGRLMRWERWTAVIWIGFVASITLSTLMFNDFYAGVDDSLCCPEHLLLIRHDPALTRRILTIGVVVGIIAVLSLVAILIARWKRATPVGRHERTMATLALPVMMILVLIPIASQTWSLWFFSNRVNMIIENGALMILPGVILGSLLRSRLSQARVGDMMRTLDSVAAPVDVERHLRAALGHAEAKLLFRTEVSEGYLGIDGRSIDVSALADLSITPLDDQVFIAHDPEVDLDLVTSAGVGAWLAIENARLQAELKAQLLEVQQSRRRLVRATDEARRRVERDLHDGAQQRLVTLSANLKRALERSSGDDPGADELLAAAAQEADVAIGELRELARGVHPAILTQAGVGPAVQSLVDRAPIPVTQAIEAERYPSEVEATAYFVITEALANSFKHSAAQHIEIEMRRRDHLLQVEVTDDGVGGADSEGSGLKGLADRVSTLGGHMEVSSPHGEGTRITALLPLFDEEDVS